MSFDFPYHLDARGRTADTSLEDHVRDLIEQVLLTAPGERVNRPEFGSGLLQLVFAPNSDELAAALQFTLQASLQQHLGGLADVEEIEVDSRDAALEVAVSYRLRATGELLEARLRREI